MRVPRCCRPEAKTRCANLAPNRDRLEKRADRHALPASKIFAQFRDHAFEFGHDDIDRNAIVRVGNARCRIASSGFHSKPDQLPRYGHSVHDRQQGIKEELAATRGGTFNKIPAFVKLSVGEVPDLERQPRGQRCQYIAPFEGGLERDELIARARRADLLQYTAPDLSVLVVGIDIDRGRDPVLKHARQPLGLC
ncbi:MAG TPA: hypothetical protein VFN63_15765, partial [Pseudolabrys sp.]|nr:hypothetical protein [Pseudolabrys sp.]